MTRDELKAWVDQQPPDTEFVAVAVGQPGHLLGFATLAMATTFESRADIDRAVRYAASALGTDRT